MSYTPLFNLPSLWPTIYPALPFYEIVEDKFYYSLTNDDETYDAWVAAAQNPTIYWSTGEAVVKAEKFSSFIIIFKCTTVERYDGCCMISENDGTICLLRTATNPYLYTYRYSIGEW